MKKLLSLVFTIATCFVACHDHPGMQAATSAQVAGKWQMTMESPHGVVKGPFKVEQDDGKLTISFDAEAFGKLSGTGSVDGNKVSFSLTVPNGPQEFGFSGTVDGSKMTGTTEMGGAWSATRDTAQAAAAQKSILGTVSGIRVKSLELGVNADGGGAVWVKFGGDTDVLLAAPGDKDLSHATPGRIADVSRDDRVLVSFVEGMAEARRIVVVSASEIARRNAAERLDWEKRGVTGFVAARDGADIVLETRSLQGAQRTTLTVTAKTGVRRYAPDSVKFADAEPASLAEIAVGDQIRARGDRSEDGGRLTAQDVVFGTFLTTLGKVEVVDREKGEVRIVDSESKKELVVRVTADTQMKKLPDLHEAPAGHGARQPASLAQMLQQLPAGGIDDLKVGGTAIVTSTRGSHPGRVTGIMVIANVDELIQIAQSQSEGASPMEALNRMHGGAMTGPGGFSLPAIMQ